MGTSSRFVVRVAFERVELDTVQLLEALPAAIACEVVLHLRCVLLHVPIERSTLPALVPANLAPVWQERGPRAGHLPCNPLRSPPHTPSPDTHCRGVSPVCVRRCTSRWFFLLKDLPQVSQVNSRTPAGGSGFRTLPSRGGYKEQAPRSPPLSAKICWRASNTRCQLPS